MSKITIKYDGKYPSLCFGKLIVVTEEKEWVGFSLCSGGSVWFDKEWNEHVESGEWTIEEWPADFPEELKADVLNAVNSQIEYGCCGGCI